MNLTPIQISTTIAILSARYEFLLQMAVKNEGKHSYASIKNEMLIINTTIRELKNS